MQQRKEWQISPRAEAILFKCAKICIFVPSLILLIILLLSTSLDMGKYLFYHAQQMQLCGELCKTGWITLSGIIACLGALGVVVSWLNPPEGFWFCFLVIFWGIIAGVCAEDTFSYALNPALYPYPLDGLNYAKYILFGIGVEVWGLLGVAQVYLPKRVRGYVISVHTLLFIAWMICGPHPYAQ